MRMTTAVAVLALSLLSSASLYAQGRSSVARGRSQGNSRVQQVISNRQQVIDRVLGRTQGTPRANIAASTRGRIPDVDALRRSALLRVGTQTGTGRVTRDFLRGRDRGFAESTAARDRNSLLRRSGASRRNENSFRQSDRTDVLRNQNGSRSANQPGNRGRSNAASNRRNRPELTLGERLLAQRLASIDRLRDIGLRNGNVRLLEKADQLEQLARQQFERRTNGTKMDAPLIFRPELRPTRRTFRDEERTDNGTTPQN